LDTQILLVESAFFGFLLTLSIRAFPLKITGS
jgi:hypothetical protein